MTTPFICHVEWGTPAPELMQRFLNHLFGWEFQAFTAEYLIYMPEAGGISVGIMKSDQMRAGGTPSVSVRVTDMDAILSKAESLGGKIVAPRMQMGTGAFAFIAAPDGNLIGLQMM